VHAAEQGVDIEGHAASAIASEAFARVRAALLASICDRVDQPEVALSSHDTDVVRRSFEFPKYDAFTWPSADLQIAATSLEAVAHGDFEWILAELHNYQAPFQNWSWEKQDTRAMIADLRRVAGDESMAAIRQTPAPEHASAPLARLFRDRFTHVGIESCPSAHSIRPANVEVFRDGASGDIRLRDIETGRGLGSLCRTGRIFFGLHPFILTGGLHTPRLRVGRIIVQRRAWVISSSDLAQSGHDPRSGLARTLLAVRDLRLRLGLPRWIYVRPTRGALQRAMGAGRDKDIKPVYVDLDSLPFIDLLTRWLHKHGELEVTEMLPTPDQIPWPREEGRRTFEIRTSLLPGESVA
jgi:hypothetical protein